MLNGLNSAGSAKRFSLVCENAAFQWKFNIEL